MTTLRKPHAQLVQPIGSYLYRYLKQRYIFHRAYQRMRYFSRLKILRYFIAYFQWQVEEAQWFRHFSISDIGESFTPFIDATCRVTGQDVKD